MTGVQPATGPRGMDAAQSEPWSADIKEKEKKKRQSQSCDCCRARKVACKEATPEEIEVALSKFAAGTSGLTDGRINLGTSTSGSPNSPSDSRDGVAALRPALSEAELLSVGGSSVPIKKDGSKRGVCKHCLTLSVKCTFDYKPRKRGPPNLYLKRLAEQQQSGSSNGHEVNAQAGPSGSQAQKSRKDSARAPRPSTSATNTTRQGGFHAPARPDASRSDSMSNPSPSQHPLYAGGLETLDGFTSFVRGEHAPGPLGTGTSPDDVSGAGGSGYGEQDYSADDNDAYPPGEHLDDRYRMDGNAFEESRGETNGNGRYGMSLRHDAGVIDPSLDQRKSLDLSKILSPPLINDSLDRSIFMQGNGTPSLNLPSILPQEYGRDHGGKTGTDSYMTLPYPQAHASSTATLGSLGHANDPQYPTGNTYHSASPLSSLINPPVQSSTHIGSQAQNPLDAILPRQLLLLIINLFFDYVFALTPCLHKPTFFRDLINRREEQPGQEEWTALVLSTVASTLVQVPRAYVPLTRKEVRELAARCHQECRNWSLHGYKEVTVSAVIIRYFDTVYNYCRGNIGTCHTSLCEAQALATVLRLHEEDTYTYLNPIEREIRRRIFFLLFGADKSEAILLGRPVRMREEDCYSLRLPEELDDDYVTEERYLAQPAGVTSLITGFNAITRIHCYVGRLMTKHREDKRDPPSGARLQRRLNELDKLHDQIMSVMDRCPSALRLKTGLDSRAQSPAGGWDVDAQAKLQEFFFDSKASREIAKDAYLVQQGNIYVTQQLARFCLLQYRSDLMVLHKKEQDIPASRLSAGASEGWTPSGGMALGGIGKSTASAPDPAADALASEKESLFYDLLSVLHSIPIQSIAVNGPSLVNNVRYVASALLDAVQTKSNKSFDSASVGVSASVLRAQGYLMDFLSILSDIERNYQLQDEGEV